MKLEDLTEELAEQTRLADAVVAKADDEKRHLSTEEQTEVDERLAMAERLQSDIERVKKLEAVRAVMAEPEGRATPAAPPTGSIPSARPSQITGGDTRIDDERMWGFRHYGEFYTAVAQASRPGAELDKRLQARALSTFGNEYTGADGGFAVPPDARSEIQVQLDGEESLLAMTDQNPTSSNLLTLPSDETTPWGSTGITATWEGESDAIAQSKPSLKQLEIRLHKLATLVPVTDELLEDSPAMGNYVSKKAPQKIVAKLNEAIVVGTGAGQPTGIINAGCTISVTKVGSQVADTFVGQNAVDMWSRCYAPARRSSVWLMAQDVEPQLLTLMKVGKLDTGAADSGWGVPLYVPAGGWSESPFGTLFGRPVLITQACETVGDVGDVILADMKSYTTAVKTGGIRAETSVHLWFDQDTTAFRFILRVGGMPAWSTTASPRDGSSTLSPFVTVAARA